MSAEKIEEQPLPPCRLFGILAREAPKGVILRRGPTDWVQLILWHTGTDVFEYGQWFHGRIESCDLSPDGCLFIYFAAKYDLKGRADPAYTHKWTAISRPPYYTALVLWPVGHSLYAGGQFVDDHTLVLNHEQSHALPHKDHLPQGLTIAVKLRNGIEDYELRQSHDGWKILEKGVWQRGKGWRPSYTWRKWNAHRQQNLVKRDATVSSNPPSYSIVNKTRDVEIPLENVSWADWDQQGRLVFTREGKLFAGELRDGTIHETMLADFNPQQPYEMVAPEWATHWPHETKPPSPTPNP